MIKTVLPKEVQWVGVLKMESAMYLTYASNIFYTEGVHLMRVKTVE